MVDKISGFVSGSVSDATEVVQGHVGTGIDRGLADAAPALPSFARTAVVGVLAPKVALGILAAGIAKGTYDVLTAPNAIPEIARPHARNIVGSLERRDYDAAKRAVGELFKVAPQVTRKDLAHYMSHLGKDEENGIADSLSKIIGDERAAQGLLRTWMNRIWSLGTEERTKSLWRLIDAIRDCPPEQQAPSVETKKNLSPLGAIAAAAGAEVQRIAGNFDTQGSSLSERMDRTASSLSTTGGGLGEIAAAGIQAVRALHEHATAHEPLSESTKPHAQELIQALEANDLEKAKLAIKKFFYDQSQPKRKDLSGFLRGIENPNPKVSALMARLDNERAARSPGQKLLGRIWGESPENREKLVIEILNDIFSSLNTP